MIEVLKDGLQVSARPPRKRRVLVVEDEHLIALDLRRRLVGFGYEVVGVADNHADAVALFSDGDPDLVLMDVHLRGSSDGIETARAIARLGDVPVIFLTAYADDETVQRASAVSPYGYLLKPFDDRTLAATIAVALERHGADTRLRLLGSAVDHATVGIVLIDSRGDGRSIVFCNDAFVALSGASRETVLESAPWFLYPESAHENVTRLHEAMAQRVRFQGDVRGRRVNGQDFWSSVSLSPVPDSSGRVTHMLAFHVDITRQREAEEGLTRSQRLELVGQLSAGVAHDFNNILCAILSYADLASHARGEGPPDAYLEGVAHAARRGTLLTRKLLDLSRSRKQAARASTDPLQVVQQNRQLAQRLAGQGVHLRVNLDSEPMWIGLDVASIEQVLLNLVVNARDAMPHGGDITVAVSRPDEASGSLAARQYVRLSVSDTGKGMDEATLSRMFEPFFSTKALGTGLGLATCRILVEQAGGTITGSSRPGLGTVVNVDFPLAEPGSVDTRVPAPAVTVGNAGGALCLLVEADALLRRACVQALERAGFLVIEAASGEAACREISERGEALAIVICDMTLSGLSAQEVFDHARAAAPKAQRIATSAHFGWSADSCGPGVSLLWKPFAASTMARWALDAIDQSLAAPMPPVNTVASSPTPVQAEGMPDVLQPVVLLVDDDDEVRSTLAGVLEREGLRVVQAAHAAGALAAIREREFQLAVIDVLLPDMDGLTLLSRMRETDPLIPVLVITGRSSADTVHRAMQGRAMGFLLKPISPQLFRQEVERGLRDGQLQRLQHKLLLARSELQPLLTDLVSTEANFSAALRDLYVVFQPLVRAHDHSVYAFEALMRSHGPMANPNELLVAAEALGRVEELGRRMRECVGRVLHEHPDRTEPVFVNLHPMEFRPDLLLREDEPLRPFASRVVWEVTERAQLSVRHQVDATVNHLRAAGYRVALDDLGEGYAGLSLLVSLAPNVAKLDMSLVRGLDQSLLKRTLVSSLLSVCRRARTLVVAEGVETQAEAAVLREIGCDLLQGYFFARPGAAFPLVN